MAKIDDLVAQITQFSTDVGTHLDALDASIASEITAAEAAIAAALKNTGATDAQVQAAMDALTSTATAISGHVDSAKANVDAETTKLTPTPAP